MYKIIYNITKQMAHTHIYEKQKSHLPKHPDSIKIRTYCNTEQTNIHELQRLKLINGKMGNVQSAHK